LHCAAAHTAPRRITHTRRAPLHLSADASHTSGTFAQQYSRIDKQAPGNNVAGNAPDIALITAPLATCAILTGIARPSRLLFIS